MARRSPRSLNAAERDETCSTGAGLLNSAPQQVPARFHLATTRSPNATVDAQKESNGHESHQITGTDESFRDGQRSGFVAVCGFTSRVDGRSHVRAALTMATMSPRSRPREVGTMHPLRTEDQRPGAEIPVAPQSHFWSQAGAVYCRDRSPPVVIAHIDVRAWMGEESTEKLGLSTHPGTLLPFAAVNTGDGTRTHDLRIMRPPLDSRKSNQNKQLASRLPPR